MTSVEGVLWLSAGTQETAAGKFRAAFAPWIFPAASLEAWRWWQIFGMGAVSSYAEMITTPPSLEIDLRDRTADVVDTEDHGTIEVDSSTTRPA